MKHYLVKVQITHDEFEEWESSVLLAESEGDAKRKAVESCVRGETEPSDYGLYDMGGTDTLGSQKR